MPTARIASWPELRHAAPVTASTPATTSQWNQWRLRPRIRSSRTSPGWVGVTRLPSADRGARMNTTGQASVALSLERIHDAHGSNHAIVLEILGVERREP